MKGVVVITFMVFCSLVSVGYAFDIEALKLSPRVSITSNASAHTRDNCECLELRAIRRILEQQFQVTCDERRCLPVPTPTASTGGELP